MPDYRFQREARTPFSEAYNILNYGQTVGRIDIHYTATYVHGLLAVAESLTTEDIEELIEIVDDDLVSSADPERPDFIVTVYQGRPLGTYTDDDFNEEMDSGNGNGHR